MERNFKLLRVFSVFFKVFAWVALIIGLIGVVGILMKGGTPETPKTLSISMLAVSLLYFVIFYAAGDAIRLLLVLEERSKKSEGPSV